MTCLVKVDERLCLKYGDALRGPTTNWRQSRGSCGDWKELRKNQPGFNTCPVSGALGPRPVVCGPVVCDSAGG